MKGVIGELRAGVSRINGEILTASGVDGGDSDAAANGAFSRVMVGFQESATAQFAKLEVCAVPWLCPQLCPHRVACWRQSDEGPISEAKVARSHSEKRSGAHIARMGMRAPPVVTHYNLDSDLYLGSCRILLSKPCDRASPSKIPHSLQPLPCQGRT